MVKRVISILCVFSTVKRAIHRPSQHEEEGYGGQKEGHVPQAPSSTQSSPTTAKTRRLGLIGKESLH